MLLCPRDSSPGSRRLRLTCAGLDDLETLANTIAAYDITLYLVLDEAHRGFNVRTTSDKLHHRPPSRERHQGSPAHPNRAGCAHRRRSVRSARRAGCRSAPRPRSCCPGAALAGPRLPIKDPGAASTTGGQFWWTADCRTGSRRGPVCAGMRDFVRAVPTQVRPSQRPSHELQPAATEQQAIGCTVSRSWRVSEGASKSWRNRFPTYE